MTFSRVLFSVCTALAAWNARAETRGPPLVLHVAESPVVRGAQVSLRDVVRDAAALPSGWAERRLFEAPAPGEVREITLSGLAYALQKYVDMHAVTLRGPVQISIQRAAEPVLSREKLAALLVEYTRAYAPWAGASPRIECDPIPASLAAVKEGTSLRVLSLAPEGGPNRYVFQVVVAPDGPEPVTVPVRATVIPSGRVWVTRRTIPRGAVLADEDLALRELCRPDLADFLPESESPAGLEVTRALRPDEPLPRYALLPPVCADRGDSILIIAERGPLLVTLRARALTGGRRGERIFCLNEQSQRRLSVRLTGAKQGVVE